MRISYRAIGNNIRLARKQIGLTQEKVSELCGMSLVHYGRIERGQRCISLEQVALIAETMKRKPEEILEGMTLCNVIPEKESKGRIGMIVDFLCAGCSEEACSLMLDICAAIAKHDKYR